MNPNVVIQRKVTRLRRGDRILAIRPACFSKRGAGVSQKSRVLGTFVMKHVRPEGTVAVVYRRAEDGLLVGHESAHDAESIVFILAEREVSKEEVSS